MRNFLLFLMVLALAGCVKTPRTSDDWITSNDDSTIQSKQNISQNALIVLTPKCENGDLNACNDAGANHEFLGDYKSAFANYDKACKGGIELGCANLGLLYEHGQGVSKDPRQAFELYKNSCNRGGMHSCYHLGNAYRKGEITQKDYALAMSAYTNACEAGDVPSCANIGAMYELGLGVQKDELRAYNIYRVACYRGLNKACPQKERLGKKLGQE